MTRYLRVVEIVQVCIHRVHFCVLGCILGLHRAENASQVLRRRALLRRVQQTTARYPFAYHYEPGTDSAPSVKIPSMRMQRYAAQRVVMSLVATCFCLRTIHSDDVGAASLQLHCNPPIFNCLFNCLHH